MSNFLTVVKKELLDILRDKKTLIITLILPILIYPLMFKFMSSSIEKTQNDVENEINIYIDGDVDSQVANIITKMENVNVIESDNPSEDLKNGDIQLIVDIPENFDENIIAGKNEEITLLIDEESTKSSIASSTIRSIYEEYKSSIVNEKLLAEGIDLSILNPFEINVKSGVSDDGEGNAFATILLSMIPTLIITFIVSSTLGMAADLGAGEKERFTFEPLLSTPIKRTSLLWGKITALCVIAFISLVANLASMVISMQSFMDLGEGNITFNLSAGTVIGMLVVCSLVLITLAALQIAVSIYARSTKEANSYLTAVVMPTMLLAFIPYMMDAKGINFALFNVPIVNSVCLMKEFTVGIFDIKHIAIVLIWHIIYITAAIIFAKFMFSREEVIFRV